MGEAQDTGKLAALDDEIAALEAALRSLRAGLAEFAHAARRTGDARERGGDGSGNLETQAKLLKQNRTLTERDIRAKSRALEDARQRRTLLVASGAGSS